MRSEQKKTPASAGGTEGPRVELLDLDPAESPPRLAVYVEDKSGKVLHQAPVNAEGGFELSEKQFANATRVSIGPAEADEKMRKQFVTYRAQHFQELLAKGEILALPKRDWAKWLFRRSCVDGSVSHCRPFPWLIQELAVQAWPGGINLPPFRPWFPRRCHRVCDGIVEVYERVCCITPWIIDDPRIPEIIIDLDDLIPKPPKPWPPIPEPGPDPTPWGPRPGPGPDPAPFKTELLFKEGALDERALYATRDRKALQSLSKFEQAAYIEARPYLWYRRRCESPVKVATGNIRPDGTFHVCWYHPLRVLPRHCHYEYAYVVKQVINGVTVTIYNGLATNSWFHADDSASLVSYSWSALSCGQDPGPDVGGDYVLLQDIGSAHSYRLKTPDATGWDRVAPPGYNDGLLDPIATPAQALGNHHNSNWGGALALRYKFSEGMRALGAKFYRVGIRAADANGNPAGAPTYLGEALSWYYYEAVGASVNVKTVALGPTTAGTGIGARTNVYEIPYETDHDWQSGQYHGSLDTTAFANGRFLVTLELFDAAGNRIHPNGTTPIEAGSLQRAFTFRRWYQETGPTAEVPFAALTHLFWWDNSAVVAEIVDLRHNNNPSTEECQFIEGCPRDTFSIGYRAYHPNPMFVLRHDITWTRGLNGGSGSLTPPAPASFQNVGQPPASPGVSATNTIQQMLDGRPKCSFSTTLGVYVKTTNGFGRLQHLDRYDVAAFALEQKLCIPVLSPPPPIPLPRP